MKNPVLSPMIWAVVTAIILQIVIPVVLGGALSLLLSGATLLDPLYASDRVSTIWSTFGFIVLIQVWQTFFTAPVTAFFLAKAVVGQWQSIVVYLVAIVASVFTHLIVLSLVSRISLLFSKGDSGAIWIQAIIINALAAPIIGIVAVYVARR